MTVTAHVEPMLRDKVLSLLQLGKRVEWIAQAWNVPRPHVIQIGLDNGLRLRAREDVMTAAPPALDVAEDAEPVRVDAKGRPIVERAPETPSRLLPPAPPVTVPEQRASEEPSDNSANNIPPKVTPVDLVKSRGARDAALAHNERVRRLGGRAAVVAWARANGHPVPPGNLGRVRNTVLDAYEKAHTTREPVSESGAENTPDFTPDAEAPAVEEKRRDDTDTFHSDSQQSIDHGPLTDSSVSASNEPRRTILTPEVRAAAVRLGRVIQAIEPLEEIAASLEKRATEMREVITILENAFHDELEQVIANLSEETRPISERTATP